MTKIKIKCIIIKKSEERHYVVILKIGKSLVKFIKRNTVMSIAFFLALMTCFFVPIDKAYINYFDFKTLACLFCVLAVVCALKKINFFYILARKIVSLFKNERMCIIALVYITFIGSMLIANDMALLTFLPLGYLVLFTSKKEKHMAFTLIMQNIAANLGGMLTPFGNPQNLYLYTVFEIPTKEFVKIMTPPFIISIALITVCCLFIKPEPLELTEEKVIFNKKKAFVYLFLFFVAIAIVFRTIPYIAGLVIIVTVLLFTDRDALKMVDYPLLFTFVFFFVFSGNMARIDIVRTFFSFLLEKSTLIFSIFSCQIISNVPSAILLSQFTDNYRDLLVGVNIGGVGTLISSLASLITFRQYSNYYPTKVKSYLKMFTIYNFGFLIILTAFMCII